MIFSESLDESPETRLSMLNTVFPGRHVDYVRVLEGGKTNSNVLIRVEGYSDTFVLRRYWRGPEVCRKEQSLLKAFHGKLPFPELIAFGSSVGECGTSFLVYRYVPGQTFREIRSTGSARDMVEAACAIGNCLPILNKCDISLLSDCRHLQRHAVSLNDLDSSLFHERLPKDEWSLLEKLYERHSVALRELSNHQGLCHGDFNHRNIVLKKTPGTWEVAAILDWEIAGTGSFLWDAARFTCYEKPDSRLWEAAFFKGLLASMAKLPSNWCEFLIVLNLLSAARSLASSSVQQVFVPELQQLIHAGLRGARIG